MVEESNQHKNDSRIGFLGYAIAGIQRMEFVR